MVMMKCGHSSEGAYDTKTGNPVCVTCVGFTPLAEEVDESPPDISGRRSRCTMCGREVDSSFNLPFFEYCGPGSYDASMCKCGYAEVAHGRPGSACKCKKYAPRGDRGYDFHYDGCRGWD